MADNKIQSLANITNNVLDAIGNVANASVSRFIGRTQIVSRVYISGTLEHNQHMPSILNFVHNMYIAALLNALNLTRYVDGARTVSDLLRPIATEMAHWDEQYTGLENIIGFENIQDELDGAKQIITGTTTIASPHPGAAAAGVKSKGASAGDNIKESAILPVGKVISIEFAPVGKEEMMTASGSATITKEQPGNGTDTKKDDKKDDRRFSIDVAVRLSPFIIPNNLIDAFMAFNYTPSMDKRWVQMRAGEISFWKDFVFAQDLVSMRSKIFRLDKSGVLAGYLENMLYKKAGIISRVTRALLDTNARKESTLNVANTVLVFTKQDVERYHVLSGQDLWGNPYARNLFLHNCMAMFIVIVDPVLNKVLFGINTYGIVGAESTYGIYNITDFDQQKKKSDMEHVTGLIKDLMSGRMPSL